MSTRSQTSKPGSLTVRGKLSSTPASTTDSLWFTTAWQEWCRRSLAPRSNLGIDAKIPLALCQAGFQTVCRGEAQRDGNDAWTHLWIMDVGGNWGGVAAGCKPDARGSTGTSCAGGECVAPGAAAVHGGVQVYAGADAGRWKHHYP